MKVCVKDYDPNKVWTAQNEATRKIYLRKRRKEIKEDIAKAREVNERTASSAIYTTAKNEVNGSSYHRNIDHVV